MNQVFVVDTNVGIVANEQSQGASPECVAACVESLGAFQSSFLLAIDADELIVDEYRRHLSLSGRPGAGDAFMRWVWNNRFNERYCRQVSIHFRANPKGEDFEEFPSDPDLAGFDHSDRKFAAVARQCEAPVMNATDSDWWNFREPLERHGIRVEFLCPERFAPSEPKKSGRREKKRKKR